MQSKFLVVGTGRAGQSRLKSLNNKVGIGSLSVSARDPHFDRLYEQHLADHEVSAVLICTGNDSHYRLAHAALTAGKHTLVEFPLCRTHQEGQVLYQIAQQNRCVLHVEFVGLMTGGHRALRRVPQTEIARIKVEMSGGYYRWVKLDAESGYMGSLLVGRLQALHDLVGPLTLKNVQCSQITGGYDLRLSLESDGGTQIELLDRRAENAQRRRIMSVYDHQGGLIEPTPESSKIGLFDADLNVFIDRIKDETTAALVVENEDVLSVMRLADRISEQCRTTSRMLKS